MKSEYQSLANAIVVQAADDYRNARRILSLSAEEQEILQNKEHNKYHDVVKIARSRKREVTKFFHSRWFSELTSADGDMILERLSKEVIA